MHSPIHSHTMTRTHARTHACTHTQIYLYTHSYTFTHTHAHTRTRAHAHTHTHTHTHLEGIDPGDGDIQSSHRSSVWEEGAEGDQHGMGTGYVSQLCIPPGSAGAVGRQFQGSFLHPLGERKAIRTPVAVLRSLPSPCSFITSSKQKLLNTLLNYKCA